MSSSGFPKPTSRDAALRGGACVQYKPCPSADELLAFHLGTLTEEALDRVGDHLEGCEECRGCVQALDRVTDPVLAALRAPGLGVADATPLPGGPGVTATEGLAALFAPPQGPEEIGRLRHYRVLKLLGRGGMGMVFQAEDTRLCRLVALKLLTPALSASAEARRRFLREARALAAVRDAEHIVAVYEVDQEGEAPFMAMELLQGEPLDHWLARRGRAAVPDVLRLGREIALGLAAAHEQGLIHRDIKPSNLWLEAKTDRVKILDFGLAQATEGAERVTQSGVVAGTPAYLSPEQARGEALDARTDLFSLGCVLYELCTGRLPFEGNGAMAVLTALATANPAPVRSLNPDIPPALATLVMELLTKDRATRPASAQAVAHRLEAIGRHQPPPRRRRRAWVAAFLLGAAVLLASAVQVYRVETSKGTVEIRSADPKVKVIVEQNGELVTILDPESKQRVELRAGEYRVKLGEGAQGVQLETGQFTLRRGGKEIVTVRRVPAPPAKLDMPERVVLAPAAPPLDHPGAVRLKARAVLPGHKGMIASVAFSPSGDLLLSAGEGDGTVRLWDAATGKVLHVLPAHSGEAFAAVFSADGKTVASVSARGSEPVRLWDARTGKPAGSFPAPKEGLFDVAFSRDGLLAAAGRDGSVRIWDVATRGEVENLSTAHPGLARGVAFAPDGKTLLSGGGGVVRLWDVAARREKWSRGWNVAPLAFSPDGTRLAGTEWKTGTVIVCDAASGKVVDCWKAHDGLINWVAFSPNSGFLATAGRDGKIRLWRLSDRRQVAVLDGHKGEAYALAFSPDGKTLASGGGADGKVRLWDVADYVGKAMAARPLPAAARRSPAR